MLRFIGLNGDWEFGYNTFKNNTQLHSLRSVLSDIRLKVSEKDTKFWVSYPREILSEYDEVENTIKSYRDEMSFFMNHRPMDYFSEDDKKLIRAFYLQKFFERENFDSIYIDNSAECGDFTGWKFDAAMLAACIQKICGSEVETFYSMEEIKEEVKKGCCGEYNVLNCTQEKDIDSVHVGGMGGGSYAEFTDFTIRYSDLHALGDALGLECWIMSPRNVRKNSVQQLIKMLLGD